LLRSDRNRGVLRAQRQAAEILASTLGLPGAAALSRGRRQPAILDGHLGSHPATIIKPAGPPPWPTFVFANGATPDGRAHPVVQRLGVALGRAGYAVHIPDLPGVANGELTPATLAAAIACTSEVAESSDTREGRVALVGVSIGATLALLVAADRRLAARISAVACIAPFSDLAKVMLLATTGMYRGSGGGLQRYPVPPALAAGLARSVAEMLSGADAATLGQELRTLAVDSIDPLSQLRSPSREQLGPAATAVRELLANRDAGRFDALYEALPAGIRETVESLSPVCSAERVLAPVEIATAPQDRYFPVAESLALAARPQVRVTITSMLAHATPRLDPRNLAGLARLDRFFVRSLLAASASS
jgi:pimeloyl-ACP methyl ester carboxylesterase